MKYSWLKKYYLENQFQLWVLNCLTEKQFINLITKKYKQKSKIELQEKIINRIIAKDANRSYWYSNEIIHRPFPAGEPAIATDAYYAYWYAESILQGPFPAGEPVIAKNAFWSYWYSKEILHGPFPAGEPAIAKNAEWSYRYARNVLHGPFPAGEPAMAIAEDVFWKNQYRLAFDIIL